MPKQIFGYTEPQNVEGEQYVRYAMAFKKDDGTIDLTVRNGAGEENTINLPPDVRAELSLALATAFSDTWVVSQFELLNGPAGGSSK